MGKNILKVIHYNKLDFELSLNRHMSYNHINELERA